MSAIRTAAPMVAVLVLALLPAAAPAQTYYAVGGGLNYAGPVASLGTDRHGFAAQASLGRQFSSRLAVRLDALISQFAIQDPPQFRGVMCAYPPSPNCPPPPTPGAVNGFGVMGLAASGVVTVDPPEYAVRMYLMAGVGTYYFYDHPSAAGAVRLGASVGAGASFKFGPSRLFVEARYHDLFRALPQPTWLVPVVLGIRF